VIRKTAKGYVVLSEAGKKLGGPYPTKQMAERRLSQVEHFSKEDKRKKKRRR
jgi:hypothetical protein